MKGTVNEILKIYAGEYTDYELYLFKNPGHYCGNIHTDNVKYIADDVIIDYDKYYVYNGVLYNREEWEELNCN